MSNAWDEETDVVVLGYGGAGAAAAISAHDAGARVVIVEKNHGGGNLGECLASGRMAGLHAASEIPLA